jgi:flagellar basal body rod protein FlgG
MTGFRNGKAYFMAFRKRAQEVAGDQVLDQLRVLTLAGLQGVTDLTPVDKGRLRGAWDVEIDGSGEVIADGRSLGRLALVDVGPGESLEPVGGVHFTGATLTPLPESARQVRSGHVEGSNVDTMRSMVEMIELHRTFDAVYALVREHHSLDERVIQQVGSSN